MSVYELLNRVGLGHWAAGFEHHGLLDRASLRRAVAQKDGLDLSTVLSWYPELGLDAEERGRMETLLKELGGGGDSTVWKLLSQAKLVTRAIIKDAAAMQCGTMARARSSGNAVADLESSLALGDRSRELGLALSDVLYDDNACEEDVFSEAADAPRRGRGLCSEWQLRNFLEHRVASVDAETSAATLAANAVDALLAPRPTDGGNYEPLSSYEWLLRCGGSSLGRLAYTLEDDGLETACKLISAGKDQLGGDKDKGKELRGKAKASEEEWEMLVNSLDYKSAKQALLRNFVAPNRCRLLHEFSQRYYNTEDTEIDAALGVALSDTLCFVDGRGRVPLRAVAELFATHDTAAEAVRAAAQLITPERTPRVVESPAPPPEATFISEWLKGISMAHLNRGFADQKLITQEDLHGLIKTGKDGGAAQIENKVLEKLAPTVGEQGRLGRALLLEYAATGTAAAARKQAMASAMEQPTVDGEVVCQIEAASSA